MKILVRGTNWIGDAVMTIPAIAELHRQFPQAHFSALTSPATVGLLRDLASFEEVVQTGSLIQESRFMLPRRFDLVVVFANSFSSALSAWLGGAKRTVGYATQRRSFLLTNAVPVPTWKATRHEVFYYLNLVQAAAGMTSDVESLSPEEPKLYPSAFERKPVPEIFKKAGFYKEGKLVVLAPGSTNSRSKRWVPDGFARVNDMLQEIGIRVVLMGSPGDRDVSSRVVQLSKHKPFDLTGETDISTAAELLAAADLLISNDMGLAHLAPAVGTETLVIFGPTNPVTTRPFSELARVVTANVECAPCMLRDCPIDHRCMTRITPDEVFELAKAALNK